MFFLKWKGREKQTQRDQEEVKDFDETGESNSQKISANRVPEFNIFFCLVSTFEAIRSPKSEPPQALRAAFPHKTGNGVKAKCSKKSKLVTVSSLLTSQVATISALSKPGSRTSKMARSFSSDVSA